MKKQIILLFLFSALTMVGQNLTDNNSKTYLSKKGWCQIKYDGQKWHELVTESKSDTEFGNPYTLISAYFTEYAYFISEKDLKSEADAQFSDYGRIRKFKTYKKQINNLTVDYLEFELNYNGKTCKYQGLIYHGKGGSIELLFAGEKESIEKNQDSINEFSNGFSLIN